MTKILNERLAAEVPGAVVVDVIADPGGAGVHASSR